MQPHRNQIFQQPPYLAVRLLHHLFEKQLQRAIILKFRILLTDAYRGRFFMPNRRQPAMRAHLFTCMRSAGAALVKRLSHLFHDASLPFRKRRVPPEFVFYVFHLDFHPALGLLPVAGRGLLRLKRTICVF